MLRALAALALVVLLAGCGDGGETAISTGTPETTVATAEPPPPPPPPPPPAEQPAGVQLSSPAFGQGGSIPREYTCDGEDASPPLAWSGLPDGTVEVVVIAADRDRNNLTHWLAYGIPATAASLPPGLPASPELTEPLAMRQGKNDLDRTGWSGPCPPGGEQHTYVFLFFALNAPIGVPGGASRNEVEEALAPLVIGNATLEATYRRAG